MDGLSNKDPDKDPLLRSYAHNSEKNASNGVISVEHRRRRQCHRQRHGRTLNNGKNPNNGNNDINGKNDKFGMDDRDGTNEYRFPESPNHLANFFASQSVFCWTLRVQTLAKVVHATGGEDRTRHRTHHTRIFFSVRAV